MNVNNDCVRAIMLYLSDNLKIEQDLLMENKFYFKEMSTYFIQNDSNLNAKYSCEDIIYSLLNLRQCRYIVTHDSTSVKHNELPQYTVIDITPLGHRFLESIRSDTIWNKTKAVAEKVGNHTLKFVEETAQMIAVESAKQAVTISLTGKST